MRELVPSNEAATGDGLSKNGESMFGLADRSNERYADPIVATSVVGTWERNGEIIVDV